MDVKNETNENMIKPDSKRRRIINVIRLLIILAVFTIAYFTLDRILLMKSEDGIEQMQSYYKQPAGTVDALFIGSSHIFCHVNTGVLWDEYGISAYNLAGAEQPFWNSYYYIKEALKTQRPKVIILDITTPGVRPTDYQPGNWVITNTYGIKRDTNRYEALKISSLKEAFPRMLIPLNSTHGRYVELSEEDFMDYSNSVNYKGFDARDTVVPFERPDISNVTERGELTEKEDKYLHMIIDHVKSENIPLLFISSPYIVTAEEQAKYNTIFDIADEYGIPYVDFNKLYDEMGLDFQTDIAEVLHLNRSGNEKFTRLLGSYLKDNYDLADHRGDNKFASWDADALYQRQDTLAFTLMQAALEGSNGKYLDMLNNENYVIFCTVPPAFEGLNDSSLGQYLEPLGIKEDMLSDVGAFILNRGQVIFSSNDYDFKAMVPDKNRRLMFCRTTDEDGYMRTLVRINGMSGYQKITPYESYEMPLDGVSFYVYDTVLDKSVAGYTIH